MSQRLQAVLFDMDGTLLDSEKVWDVALNDTASWLGGTLSADARNQMVGSSLQRSVGILHADLAIRVDPEATAAYLLGRTEELFAFNLVFKPGALELLQAVQDAKIPAALVTSTHRRLTERALDTIGRQYFGVTICGDEVGKPKPHPEPYLLAARQLGVEPGATVALEDSPLGIAAAEAAGCAVIAVPSEVSIEPALTTVVRDSLLGLTVSDLQKVLDRYNQVLISTVGTNQHFGLNRNDGY